MRILITGAGGPAGQALIRQLASRHEWVAGVDMQAVETADLSRFDHVPAASDPELLPALLQIIRDEQIDLLIPTVAEELTVIADATARGFIPCPVVIGEPDAVAAAHDKLLTMQRLHTAGVPIPDFCLPSEAGTAEEAFQRFGSPLLVKPRVGRGSRGVALIHRENPQMWEEIGDDMIVQEFAPGDEFAPMVHVSVRTGADRVGLVAKKHSGGCRSAGTYVSPVPAGDELDVAAVALDAVRGMGLTGPVDLDLRRNRENQPVVLEVNARFGANSEHFPELIEAVLADYSSASAAPASTTVTPGSIP